MTTRSAVDATRFTANSPHAYSQEASPRPSSSTSTSQPPGTNVSKDPKSPLPKNGAPPSTNASNSPPETPHEKVARLRAARLAERQQKLSTWERTVIRGRVWADRIHRITALSLIGFTIVAAGVTTFTLTDMVLHNRRKRQAFYDEQHAIYNARLVAAIETEKAGIPLADDQVLILSRERMRITGEEQKKNQGVWLRMKNAVFGGLKTDMGGTDERISVPSEADVLARIGVSSVGILEAAEGKAAVTDKGELEGVKPLGLADQALDKRRELGTEEISPVTDAAASFRSSQGGMLDRMAEAAVNDVKGKSSSWFNWRKGT